MAQHDILRISREIADIEKGANLSLSVAYQEHDLRRLKALIVGPPATPYEYGFFEFSVKFGPDYPLKAPKVDALTTNSGRCRFNPNIYAGGKVCLSILGTWHGQRGEEWSAAQGLESVLLSIQSLMSSNPYENEPGFENSKGEQDKEAREAYCAKIRHETLRVAVIQPLENILRIQPDGTAMPVEVASSSESEKSEDDGTGSSSPKSKRGKDIAKFEPFNDLKKRRFLWYYENYLATVDENASNQKDGVAFNQMPFEHSGNSMSGSFQYAKLRKRLVQVKDALNKETDTWAEDGMKAVQEDLSSAYNLRNQFMQFCTYQKEKNIHNIEVSLLEDNPFIWILTYFGRSGSNLDGGIFRIRLSLSTRFPLEQPRLKFETAIYHHCVAKDGTICYTTTKTDEVKYHIEAVVLAIEEVSPPYDPRAIVNAEAAKLFWGSEAEKRLYCRKQRRSAQDSVEGETA